MHRGAELIFGENAQPIRCRIWDMSERGARLALTSPNANIPHNFTLVLFKGPSVRRDCELVWTDRHHIGIKFLSGWY
jgi:hypothetical protein